MVDNNTALLISSVIINVLLIIDKFMKRITKSECCGAKLELEHSKTIQDLNKNDIELSIEK